MRFVVGDRVVWRPRQIVGVVLRIQGTCLQIQFPTFCYYIHKDYLDPVED